MDKYKEIIKEILLSFCVKSENFEFSTHFEKSYLRCLLRYRQVLYIKLKGILFSTIQF